QIDSALASPPSGSARNATFSVGRSPRRIPTYASGCGLPRASSGSQFGPALCGNTWRVANTRWRRTSTEDGMSRLKGKVALITGGSSGIGESTVRLFVEEGASVMVADIQDDRGKKLAEELGARVAYVHADVSQEAHVKAAVDDTCRRFGRLDCIFNNAGYGGVGGKIEDVSADGFDATIAELLRGVFVRMRHTPPVLKQQGNRTTL